MSTEPAVTFLKFMFFLVAMLLIFSVLMYVMGIYELK